MIGRLSGKLVLTFLSGMSLIPATGLMPHLRTGHVAAHLGATPRPSAKGTTPDATVAGLPRIASVAVTPAVLVPLDRATFATTFFNDGFGTGPYRATLQLLSRAGGSPRSATQSGFLLRHHRPITLYWEWRAGASLPPGTYAVRVLLSDMAGAAPPLATRATGSILTITPR